MSLAMTRPDIIVGKIIERKRQSRCLMQPKVGTSVRRSQLGEDKNKNQP